MSSGDAPSDIVQVKTFSRKLYRQCKNAGGEYVEIGREVRGLHTVLKHLKYEVEAPESVLNRDQKIYAKELAPIIGDCDFTLRQLEDLLEKYDRLGRERGTGQLWDKTRFSSDELDELGSIRMKLISHKTSITVFLDTVQLRETSRVSATLDTHSGQLDTILDKVDNIAVRMSQRAGTVMTVFDDDDAQVWKQFRRELIAEGFSSHVLQQHKDVLRAYIRQIEQDGLLDETLPETQTNSPASVQTERWLETVGPPSPQASKTELIPPSFESLHLHKEDVRVKEMVVSEDNLKFPQSIKSQSVKPGVVDKQAVIPQTDKVLDQNGAVDKPSLTLPRLTTTALEPTSLESSLSPAALISTTDLMLYSNKADNLRRPTSSYDESENVYSPSSSPIESRNATISTDGRAPRYIAARPRTTLAPDSQYYGTSPSQYGTSPRSSTSLHGNSPRTSTLAPDSVGRDIPLDAKWTRIRRSLISTEVLEQDKRRFEARPDFVAVLGVLSREEIEDLAIRSQSIRDSRRNRAPAQPPRLVSQQSEKPRRKVKFDEEREEYSSDEEEYEIDNKRPPHERRTYPKVGSNYGPPHLQPRTGSLPQQYISPVPQWTSPPPQYGAPPMWIPPPGSPQQYYLSSVESSRPRLSISEKPKKEKEKEARRSRFRDLTAAGIGGAAVSLLSVLSEAAESL